ncbi:MAG: sigma 54-interacting transcriptional regulator [Magnetococcales bacterium]|nr:sigma 54-interacting transcriptional regulator [Magnetococcales bacterium]
MSGHSSLLLEASSFLDSYSTPALLMDLNYRVVAWNRAYSHQYHEPDTEIHRYCYELSHQYDRPCDQVGEPCPMSACLETKTPQRMLHIHITPQGRQYVHVEMRPLMDSDGQISHLLEVFSPTRIASVSPKPLGLVGHSPAFKNMLKLIDRVAKSRVSVLLTGESGTGKEVVARTIHEESPRANMSFVPVECSGLTEALFESELFGHEKGAFTGALLQKKGLVELADHGTLFLDEIGDVPLQLQVKLLRLLETKTFRRVGGIDALHTDFRLICATHRDLPTMVERGEFRLDLFYRISTFPIVLPPLHERREDIAVLAQTLILRLDECRGKRLTAAALEALTRHTFIGNIRELLNLMTRGCLMSDGTDILPEHMGITPTRGPADALGHLFPSLHEENIMTLEAWEALYLGHLIHTFRGNKKELASRLGISERTLYRKLGEGIAENMPE